MTHVRTRPDPTDRDEPATRFVLPLAEFGRGDLASAGGKGANLGELVRAGFPVPNGVVISTDAYAAVAEHAGLAPVGGDDAALREAFDGVEIPEALRNAVLDAYARLGSGPVAVRSSATAEDLPGAAFAGQQDTYLNVVGPDALLHAVRRCWGSLWTERAIAYRARRDIAPDGVRIAVVVQRMVPSEYAGVLFTANPTTGARDEVVVDASSGLGEAVVSGLVTPDHYVLGSDGSVRERRPGRREVVVRSATEGGVERSSDEAHLEVPDAVLAELAALGRSVAAHFGRPQDIEWAWAGGRLWLVQARPMTALPPPPIRLSRIQRFTGPHFVELMPVRPYPLDMSGWILPGVGRMVQRMLAEIPGLRVDVADVLPERDGVVDRFVPPHPHLTRRVLGAPARNLPRLRRFRPAAWTRDPRFTRFDREIRELTAIDMGEVGWTELRGLPRRALAAMDLVTDLRVDYLPRVGVDLLRLRALRMLLRRTDLSGLTLGTRTRTEDANRALAELAEQVRGDEALRAVFRLAPHELAERIANDPAFARFRAALTAFLGEYGHRETSSMLLMSAPTWGEVPATVLGMVKVLVEGARPAAAEDRAELAEKQLLGHPLVRRSGSADRVRRLLADMRAGIAFREDTHFHGTRVLPVLRRAVLEMGRRMTAAGLLRDDHDVLHLRWDELESLSDPATVAAADVDRVRAAVRALSARRAELAGVPLIAPAVLFAGSTTDGNALVTGTAASGGRATGPVRVIRDTVDFGLLRSGDVLVCPYTNPAWTPLFQRAAAVVVDTGGVGSHAAIVAREYGIPAVMGSATGTTTLVDGQVVMVDGDTGRVRAIGPASGDPQR